MVKLDRLVRAFGLTVLVASVSASTLVAQTPAEPNAQILPEPKLESPYSPPKASRTPSDKKPAAIQVYVPYTMDGPAPGYSDTWFARATAWLTGGKTCGSLPAHDSGHLYRTSYTTTPSVVRKTDDLEHVDGGVTNGVPCKPERRKFMPSFDSFTMATSTATSWMSDAFARATVKRRAKPRYIYRPPQLRACDKSYRNGPVQSECDAPLPPPTIEPLPTPLPPPTIVPPAPGRSEPPKL